MNAALLQDKLSKLEAENAQLGSDVERLTQESAQYRELYMQMLEAYRKLEKGLVGRKAEVLEPDDRQLTMDILAQLFAGQLPEAEKPESTEVPAHQRRKPTGRKPLPDHLPRVRIELLPPEVEKLGLDAFERIGEEISEVVERRPSSVVIVQVVRPKFVAKDRDRQQTEVHIAEPAQLPIPKGLAGPGMLADSVVRRWQDHLPLNRLEGIYARDGLALSRSTMCSWHDRLGELVAPLIEAMFADALNSPYLCTDATGVLVQEKGKCRRSHFWVLVAPERHVLFHYTRRHTKEAVDSMLADYEGYLVADAHTVYDHLYLDERIVEVGCWAHARRYFFKALGTAPELARHALALIKQLFRIERNMGHVSKKKKGALRKARAGPVIELFFNWCDEQAATVLDETPIAKAIGYARNQREALSRFLEDGRLPLHNNISELQLRRQAIGRKNWLFVGSDDGGVTNTRFVTLLASCQMHGIEPWGYLRDLLCLLPDWPRSRVLELAPVNWKQTLEQGEAQQRLAADVFRQVVLGRE